MKPAPTHDHTNHLIRQGYPVVAGVDEVGRGCLAGPVVAAAVILLPQTQLIGARDSKLLSSSQRRRLATDIKRQAVAIGIGWVGPELIDREGLTWALGQAGLLALRRLGCSVDAVLLDGTHNYLPTDYIVQTVTHGDSLCLNVAAASIVAKVARDGFMRLQHRRYPEFGFDRHVGYGTAQHLAALQHGVTPLHRRSVAPVAAAWLAQTASGKLL